MGCPLAGELEKGPREWARRRWTDRWGRRGGRWGVEPEETCGTEGAELPQVTTPDPGAPNPLTLASSFWVPSNWFPPPPSSEHRRGQGVGVWRPWVRGGGL